MTTYEKDFFKWTNEQVSHLKKKEFSDLDIMNLIEEIHSLGNSEKRALRSYLERLFLHLLKLEYQPKKKSKSWIHSIQHSKEEISISLQENPSLKPKLQLLSEQAYRLARNSAAVETGLDIKTFPDECPWNIKEILND